MPVISIRIPQLGEGLQEALLVEFIKQPGDRVQRDEPIYVMETDKATTDVESPYEGTIVAWTVEPGTVLSIGSEIGRIEVAEGVKEVPAGHGPGEPAGQATPAPHAASTGSPPTRAAAARSDVQIPPKTRKYLKELGLLDVVDQIPCTGSKLMPEDVDRYLASQGGNTEAGAGQAAATPKSTDAYGESLLPTSQISLNYRLTRGTKLCVPVTIINDIEWTSIQSARDKAKTSGGPTGFGMGCWCVVQALKRHPKFRSSLSADGRILRTYQAINLGVAVALPGDEMVTAVVRGAEQMDPSAFFAAMTRQIEIARDGKDQADEATSLSVSNMGKAGIRIGIPAIVAPAVATLALGVTFWNPIPAAGGKGFEFKQFVTATLSFDHRVVNGVGAANFLNDVKSEIEQFRLA